MEPNSRYTNAQEQEGGKFIIDSTEFQVDNGAPLPLGYDDHRLVILPRDPFWFFAYWEIAPHRLDALRQEHGPDVLQRGQSVLRVYDVKAIRGDDVDANSFFDENISLDSRQWYVRVPEPGRFYLVDLGIRLPDGRFLSLIRSNRIHLPAGRVSDQTDSQWMDVYTSGAHEEWNRLLGDAPDHVGHGSAEVSKNMALRWEFLRAVFSGSSSKLSQPVETKR